METDPKYVSSTRTAFQILDEMKQSKPISVTELSQRVETPKSTVYRHLNTLLHLGYIQKNNGKYRLSLRFLDLAEWARQQRSLYSVLKPEMNKLVQETGERAQVLVEEDMMGVYIYQQIGEEAAISDSRIGKQVYLHASASGKAYLAFLSDERVFKILEEVGLPSLTPGTITQPETLLDELDQIRKQGYAFNDEEEMKGIRGVGAPICHDKTGEVVGSLSFAAPKTRFRGNYYQKIIPKYVKDICNILGVKVAYQ